MTLALEIHDLKKTYANGVQALKGIHFSVRQGEFVALLGPNGAGKSTTISIINSLVLKTSGSVAINGYSIDTQLNLAKAQIGVVPQEFNFSMFEKIKNTLLYQAGYYGIPFRQAKIRVEKYLKLLELWDKRDEVARSLSGGMKRRLMIARALVHEPAVLILDEPTAGVDVEIRRSMWDFLRELNRQGRTIILTTHYLEEAEQLCDRIAIINHGNIIHDTTKRQLLNLSSSETWIVDLQQPISDVITHNHDFEIRVIDPMTLEIVYPKNKNLNALFDFFNQYNIIVTSMRHSSNRLEELFLKLTHKGV